MTRPLTAVGVLVVPALALVLAGCGGGTDSAVPGPTLPTVGASTSSAAAVEPVVASSDPSSSAASGGSSQDADPAGGTTPTGGAPDAVTPSGSGTATAGLVTDFPADVIPLLPGATVTASAVRTSGERLDVSLSGTSTKSADAILAFYDKTFRKQGFESTDGRTLAPGTGGRIYARGDEVLVVAVEGAGAKRSFSVGGTVQR